MHNKKLKIGICCYPTFGGSGVIATEIGLALAGLGHQVHFISYDIPRRLPEYTENIFFHEVEFNDYPIFEHQPYALSLTSKIVEVATFEKLDLLHVHYAVPHATSAYLAKQILKESAPKIITTLHGTDITLVGRDKSYLPIIRFSIINSDAITTPSEFLKKATYEILDIPSTTSIKVIPNFVDIDLYKPDSAKKNPAIGILGKCPRESDTKIILHVSNFRPVKRVTDVIKIFNNISKHINSHLVMIGDGPERSSAEYLARELGIHDKICFLGKQESFIPWLQQADLFLLPSELESFGLAALEAMSCGVPVIASDVQGIPEVVKHEVSGFLAPVGDIETMSKYSVTLLSDEELLKKMKHNARENAITHFESNKIIDSYINFYREVLTR